MLILPQAVALSCCELLRWMRGTGTRATRHFVEAMDRDPRRRFPVRNSAAPRAGAWEGRLPKFIGHHRATARSVPGGDVRGHIQMYSSAVASIRS